MQKMLLRIIIPRNKLSINKNYLHDDDEYISIGVWVPLNNSVILQHLKGEEQKNAIKTLLNQGFHEYYFAVKII